MSGGRPRDQAAPGRGDRDGQHRGPDAQLSPAAYGEARHRIPLNRIGAPIHLTTGRRLVDEYDPALGDVVVMLDGHLRCADLVDRYPDLEVYWGAQLGAPGEAFVTGQLSAVIEQIRLVRKEIRDRDGWVMDT